MYVASNGIKTAVILRDADPLHPRHDQDNLGKMICWHDKYNLGDFHKHKTSDDFAEALAARYLSLKDVVQAIQNGKMTGLRLDIEKDFESGEHYRVMIKELYGANSGYWASTDILLSTNLEPLYGGEAKAMDDLLDYCYGRDLLQLCSESGKLAILPVYLYDHSNLAISTGSFIGRAHHAEWDSSQVGYIYLDRETAMKEMAMEADTLRLARVYPESERNAIKFTREVGERVDEAMEKNGYSPVKFFHVKNLYDCALGSDGNQPLIDEYQLRNGGVFKKDRTLYVFAGHELNGGFLMQPVATFNPDLKSLTEETWKDRALECLKSEVKEYDNFLQHEVYGYTIYEGLDEVDSCWSFNPGREDIKDVIKAELTGWMTPDMDFELSCEESFDIEEYFADNDFPKLREKIQEEVKSAISFHGEFSPLPYPFGIPAEDLLANKDGSLDNIVEALYDEHIEHDSNAVYEAIIEHAGQSRDLKPKITVADLDPNKDYTAEELLDLVQQKASLNDMISHAAARRDAHPGGKTTPTKDQDRDFH